MRRDLKKKRFYKDRHCKYARYSGTKHAGGRRGYAAANPIPYFQVCDFIGARWSIIETKYQDSKYTLASPKFNEIDSDRAIQISSLNGLDEAISRRLSYSPYVLKADISQFYPSVYTHSIPWSIHGVQKSKSDTRANSSDVIFNQLDYFVQQCQDRQTRGLLIGPDGFRLIAEIISSDLDMSLHNALSGKVIGAVRYVDDFYLGFKSETDAVEALSVLRSALAKYELQVNDHKTKISTTKLPTDDGWADDIRSNSTGSGLGFRFYDYNSGKDLDDAVRACEKYQSSSPLKLAIRKLDDSRACLNEEAWSSIEPRLQRYSFHYPHCVDYICLLVGKRVALNLPISEKSWASIAELVIKRGFQFGYHHEVCWFLWVVFIAKLNVSDELLTAALNSPNAFISSMSWAAFSEDLFEIKKEPKKTASFNSRETDWLLSLTHRVSGQSGKRFSGNLSEEFEFLVEKNLKLVNFQSYFQKASLRASKAISRSKFGYDDDSDAPDFDEIDFELDDDIPF